MGVRQKDVAAELGVKTYRYQRWENGAVAIPIDFANPLARYFGLSLGELLTGVRE